VNAVALSASLAAAKVPEPAPARVRNSVTSVRKNRRAAEAEPPRGPPGIDDERLWLLRLAGLRIGSTKRQPVRHLSD